MSNVACDHDFTQLAVVHFAEITCIKIDGQMCAEFHSNPSTARVGHLVFNPIFMRRMPTVQTRAVIRENKGLETWTVRVGRKCHAVIFAAK